MIDGWRLAVTGSRSERAPVAEELFANGPHAGTQSFEIGDPNLRKERSWGLEASLRTQQPAYSLSIAGYASSFDNYIYEALSGEPAIDGLPVFRYAQGDATYYGVEAEASLRLAKLGGVTIVADGVADYVRATIDAQGPAPRIPPVRVLGGIEAQGRAAQARLEAEHVARADRTAAFETPTPGYTMVNASLNWQPFGADTGTSLTLSANNLFDVDARRHASFLKDFAPLAGRDVRLSARVRF